MDWGSRYFFGPWCSSRYLLWRMREGRVALNLVLARGLSSAFLYSLVTRYDADLDPVQVSRALSPRNRHLRNLVKWRASLARPCILKAQPRDMVEAVVK